MYHTVETITTNEYIHVIVAHSGDNHNYLVQTHECTPQWGQ